ncbi:MAG: ACT domain-containing protein [Candidatus Omnitrophica bacterium]|nr:ACT domain-containing protein [Candidatus Omnitrophota bacterium]MBI2173990.1 ACT domain-containing protein [Candidatus Omnitrophota bacterium]MBI3009719.1 ACT domain-containing protein [Candidatus Omnitrophota bacterium]
MEILPQLAIFLDNRPGTLARVCQGIAKAKINILALSIVDTVDHAIVRMVVDDPKAAEKVLSQLQVSIQCHNVILLEIPNQVGALAKIAERLAEAGVNLEYAYCAASASQSSGTLVLRTSDLEATIAALS